MRAWTGVARRTSTQAQATMVGVNGAVAHWLLWAFSSQIVKVAATQHVRSLGDLLNDLTQNSADFLFSNFFDFEKFCWKLVESSGGGNRNTSLKVAQRQSPRESLFLPM
jgi:hypothetical protein